MAHFIKLTITDYDDRGAPAIDAKDIWINIDQVTHAQELLDNNLFHRHATGAWMPEEHYPYVLLTTTDGTEHLATLGVYPDIETSSQALNRFISTLTQHAPDPLEQQLDVARVSLAEVCDQRRAWSQTLRPAIWD